jgi:hypothetical protein
MDKVERVEGTLLLIKWTKSVAASPVGWVREVLLNDLPELRWYVALSSFRSEDILSTQEARRTKRDLA